jgi:hypothetical protein
MAAAMDQCSILYVTSGPQDGHVRELRGLGFRVTPAAELPSNEAFAEYHAVIVRAPTSHRLPMLAARLRAKPYFARRVLLALVPEEMPDRDKREAIQSGFDDTMTEHCGARDLAAAILRLLRPYPEFRCLLRTPNGRHKAA